MNVCMADVNDCMNVYVRVRVCVCVTLWKALRLLVLASRYMSTHSHIHKCSYTPQRVAGVWMDRVLLYRICEGVIWVDNMSCRRTANKG